jgi:antitoxin component YwqK of YwqJK toxin-antitoxin module
MGLFDFLKSNKNIITDNGINFIYYDNGKGSIKEKFSKINGVLNGEYFKYEVSGEILSTDYYHDGHIITLDEKQRIDDEKRRIENNEKEKTLNEYKNKIFKLIEIDKIEASPIVKTFKKLPSYAILIWYLVKLYLLKPIDTQMEWNKVY